MCHSIVILQSVVVQSRTVAMSLVVDSNHHVAHWLSLSPWPIMIIIIMTVAHTINGSTALIYILSWPTPLLIKFYAYFIFFIIFSSFYLNLSQRLVWIFTGCLALRHFDSSILLLLVCTVKLICNRQFAHHLWILIKPSAGSESVFNEFSTSDYIYLLNFWSEQCSTLVVSSTAPSFIALAVACLLLACSRSTCLLWTVSLTHKYIISFISFYHFAQLPFQPTNFGQYLFYMHTLRTKLPLNAYVDSVFLDFNAPL